MKDIAIENLNEEVVKKRILLASSILSDPEPMMTVRHVLKNILCLSEEEIKRLL